MNSNSDEAAAQVLTGDAANSAAPLSLGTRLFGPQRYRAVPWTVWEVSLLIPMVVAGVWRALLPADRIEDNIPFVAFSQIAILLMLAAPIVTIVYRHAKPYQMGLHFSHFWRNAAVGFVAYFLAAPIVTFTNLIALQFFERTPHEIEKSIIESPTIPRFVEATIAAVVIAPILEELAFRGILQPWLRRIVGPGPAVLLSSLIFAIAHFNAWPAPIALFVLALFLGFLAQRTTSLVPSMVLHATFNAANMAILLAGVLLKQIPVE
jgi:membrane protease YdiL (CAAX protease family)